MIGARTLSNQLRTEDLACATYAKMGFSMDLISKRTGLSKGVVAYRLKLFGVKLADYRNGKSEAAQKILAVISADTKTIYGEVKKLIAERIEQEHKAIDI